MGRVDRAVRRAHRRLHPGELLLSSLGGVDVDGGGRRVLLATDRRVLFCGRPSAEAVEMSLSASASFDEPRRTLTVTDGDRSVSLARVDRVEGRQFVRFLGNRQDISLADRIGAPFHVEVVDPPA